MGPRLAYLDCFSGASGDMLLGALLDAGLELDDLRADLAALPLGGYELHLHQEVRHGLRGNRFEVIDRDDRRPAHNLPSVRRLIGESSLPAEVAEPSLAVFTRLAEAEARVHGTTVDEVHFHEVGALDTLVDVVGFCFGLRRLGIERVYASALPVGGGSVRAAHGVLPVPAPATLELLAAAGAPILSPEASEPARAHIELVTPTGAAILAALATFARPTLRVERVGHGFGHKELPWPNLLRVWIGQPAEAAPGSATPDARAAGPHHSHHHHHDA